MEWGVEAHPQQECTGCGICADVCPHDAIQYGRKRWHIPSQCPPSASVCMPLRGAVPLRRHRGKRAGVGIWPGGREPINNVLEKKVRAAAVAGWWVVLVAVAFIVLQWLIYLAVMHARPAWVL